MEMTQFNGFFGCAYCLAPGESVQSGRGHAHAYPYMHDQPSGHAVLRTHRQFLADAEEADQINEKVHGIKGTTWFMYLPRFDFVRGIAIDYMHFQLHYFCQNCNLL